MAKRRPSGDGMVRRREDGRWEGRYTAGYDPDTGKRIIKNVLGRTQAEAKEKLKAAVEQTQQVDITRTDEYTVATWLHTWYDLYAQPNVRQATADRYKLMIETYTIPRIGKIKLKKLTSRDLQKMYKNLMEHGRVNTKSGHGNPGLSSTTVRSVHLMLHSAFERAVKERLIPRNPTDDCIAPKVQKVEMKTLRPEHLKSYLDAANARSVLPMFYLELVSGLRKGELVALLWDDLDIQNRTISVSKQYIKNPSGKLTLSRPKTETSVRRVSIPQEAVDLLIQEHEKHPENPYMFPSSTTGEMYYPDSVVKLHEKILKDAGLEHIRFHDLRHTFSTVSLEHGMDIKTLSTIIGHVSSSTTLNVYAHVTDEMRRTAAVKIDQGIGKADPKIEAGATPQKPAPSTFQAHKGQRRKAGTGCVTQINEKLWEGRYSPVWPDGKKHARNVYAHSEEECEKLLADMIAEMKAEIAAEKERLKAAPKAG